MDENNEMEVPFEPADQHISVRITTKEKKLLIKWCKELRLSKSQGIRKLIVDRLASPEQIQEATDDLTDEIKELKRAVSEIKQQLENKPKPKLNTWVETAEKIIEKPDDANAIYVPRERLEKKILIKKEIAVLAGISVSTLGDIGRYKYESGEPVYPKVGVIATRGLYDCSKVSGATYPMQYKVDIDWSRLLPK
jgi:Sec-independent protein translocase protein TatA